MGLVAYEPRALPWAGMTDAFGAVVCLEEFGGQKALGKVM